MDARAFWCTWTGPFPVVSIPRSAASRSLVLLLASVPLADAAVLSPLTVSSREAKVGMAIKLRGGSAPALLPEGFPSLGGAAGIGGILGYCSGKAARTAADGVAVAVGAATVCAALLTQAGYITVNYKKVEHDLTKLLDFNKDGKVDDKDYVFASERLLKLMTDNGLGSGAGFAAGFYTGFKS